MLALGQDVPEELYETGELIAELINFRGDDMHA